MVKATDTRPGTKGAPTKETAKNMSEVQNDIQIRQKDVDDFTEEEKKFFENVFIRKDPIKIVRTQNNPIILRENEEFKGEVPILKKLQHTAVQDHLNNTYHILMVNPGTTAIVTNNNTNILDSETNRPTSIPTTKKLRFTRSQTVSWRHCNPDIEYTKDRNPKQF